MAAEARVAASPGPTRLRRLGKTDATECICAKPLRPIWATRVHLFSEGRFTVSALARPQHSPDVAELSMGLVGSVADRDQHWRTRQAGRPFAHLHDTDLFEGSDPSTVLTSTQAGAFPPLEPPPGHHLTSLPLRSRRTTMAKTTASRRTWRSNWSNRTSKRNARHRSRIRRSPLTCRSTSRVPPQLKYQSRAPQSTLRPAVPSQACRPHRSRLQYNP